MAASATPSSSPLLQLHRRRDGEGQPWIGPAAFMAGELLTADLVFAGMLPKVTMDWSRGAPRDRNATAAGLNPTEAGIAARDRVRRAMDAVGPDLSGVLIDFCGFEKGLEQLERERNWPVRSGKIVVKLALGVLARHYGLSDGVVGPRSRGIRAGGEGPAQPVRRMPMVPPLQNMS